MLAQKLPETGADIICLQEAFHRPLQDCLYNQIRHHYPYARGFAPKGFKLRLGNELLVFSRFPLEGGKLIRFNNAVPEELRHTSKGFFHVSVILEDYGKLELVNFHTTAGGRREHPESEKMNAIRAGQIEQLLAYVKPLGRTILAGDLNAGPHSSLQNYRQLDRAGYIDTFNNVPGREGYTWDPANPLVAAGAEANLPPQRIDHIFLHSGLFERARIHNTEIVLKEICVEAGGGIPLSDHYGILSSLQFD